MLTSNILDAASANNAAFMAHSTTRNLVAVENPDSAIAKAVDDFFVATVAHTSRANHGDEKSLIPSFDRQMVARDQLWATITGLQAELEAAKAKADDLQKRLDFRGEPMCWGVSDAYEQEPEPKPEFRNQLDIATKAKIMDLVFDVSNAQKEHIFALRDAKDTFESKRKAIDDAFEKMIDFVVHGIPTL